MENAFVGAALRDIIADYIFFRIDTREVNLTVFVSHILPG